MIASTTEQVRICLALAGTAKALARDAGVHHVTAARWQRGETEPSASSLLRLMARRKDLAARLLRAAGLDDASLAAERAHLDAQLASLLARRATLDEPAHTSPPPTADATGTVLAGGGTHGDGARATHPLRRATDRAVAVTPRCHEARVPPTQAPAKVPAGSFLPGCSAATTPSRHLTPAAAERTAAGGFSGEGA